MAITGGPLPGIHNSVLASAAQIEWGSVPVWVGMLTASASAVVAAATYRRNVRDRERDQASRVSSWISGAIAGDTAKNLIVVVRVANRSDAPIYDVALLLRSHSEVLTIDEIPPGQVAQASLDALRGFREARITAGADLESVSVTFDRPELRFTDALGRRWVRTRDRRLRSARGSAGRVDAARTLPSSNNDPSTPTDVLTISRSSWPSLAIVSLLVQWARSLPTRRQ